MADPLGANRDTAVQECLDWWTEHLDHEVAVMIEIGGKRIWNTEGAHGTHDGGWSALPDVITDSVARTPLLRLRDTADTASYDSTVSYYYRDELPFDRSLTDHAAELGGACNAGDVIECPWGRVVFNTKLDLKMLADCSFAYQVEAEHRGMV